MEQGLSPKGGRGSRPPKGPATPTTAKTALTQQVVDGEPERRAVGAYAVPPGLVAQAKAARESVSCQRLRRRANACHARRGQLGREGRVARHGDFVGGCGRSGPKRPAGHHAAGASVRRLFNSLCFKKARPRRGLRPKRSQRVIARRPRSNQHARRPRVVGDDGLHRFGGPNSRVGARVERAHLGGRSNDCGKRHRQTHG